MRHTANTQLYPNLHSENSITPEFQIDVLNPSFQNIDCFNWHPGRLL